MRPIRIPQWNPVYLGMLQAHTAYLKQIALLLENNDQGNVGNFQLALHILKSADVTDKAILYALGLSSMSSFNLWRTHLGIPDGPTRVAAIKAIIGLLRDNAAIMDQKIANIVAPDK